MNISNHFVFAIIRPLFFSVTELVPSTVAKGPLIHNVISYPSTVAKGPLIHNVISYPSTVAKGPLIHNVISSICSIHPKQCPNSEALLLCLSNLGS